MRAIKFSVVLAGMLAIFGCASPRSMERGAQGAALGDGIGHLAGKGPGAVAGGLIGGAIGSVVGTLESDKNMAIGASVPLRRPQNYHHLPCLEGKRVVVWLDGRGNDSSIRGIVVDYFRAQGAEVIAPQPSHRHRQDIDALYNLEIQTRSEGNRAVVELWLVERATNTILLHGLGVSEFYYEGSDRWRSYQWAASRALSCLR